MSREKENSFEIKDLDKLEYVYVHPNMNNRKYQFSINGGEFYFDTTQSKAKEIIRFLKLIEQG